MSLNTAESPPARGGRPDIAAPPRSLPGTASGNARLLAVFIFCMLLPVKTEVGGVDLYPVRLFVMVMYFPLVARLFSGRAGPLRTADLLIGLHCLWIFLTYLVHHGGTRLPLASITVVEVSGGWLIGRALIRTPDDFEAFVRYMIIAAVFMLPFALVEFITNRNILQDIFGIAFDTFRKGYTSYGRLGFERVMAGFAHPILYGLFCSMAVGLAYYVYRARKLKGVMLACFMAFMTFMSLSSGPFLAAVTQIGLIAWDKVTNAAWRALLWLSVSGYVVVDLLSNRTPITIAINYVTFNSDTAWYRVAIWKYGSAEVWRHPVFGIGLNDWLRPGWLTGSVDNFWLVVAMRHGAVGFLFLALAIFFVIRAVTRVRGLSPRVAQYRTGYMVTLTGVLLTASTVHVWDAMWVFLMFFFAAGLWIADWKEDTPPPAAASPQAPRDPRYTRIPLRATPRRKPV